MARYDRSYDFGLRGARETNRFRRSGAYRARGYDAAYESRSAPRPNRVTARYNLDYVVGNRGKQYPRNFNTYMGDREDRIDDLRYFRAPYTTIGGTRTFRGASQPFGYDRGYFRYDRDFGY